MSPPWPTRLEKGGIEAGRRAVSMIVGRDTRELDEGAVSRAAIESLAENFSDGVVAPLFWLAVAGLPGAIAYKAINTADSMIGHKSERHLAFGWAAARADDLVNLPASRLSALWLVLGAALVPGLSPGRAIAAVWRDAGHHDSPNAGWPEAAMAGALGVRLAGPRVYDGEIVEDHWMGDGRSALTAKRHSRGPATLSHGLRTPDRRAGAAGRAQLAALKRGSRASASRRSQSTCFSMWSASRSSVASTSAS